MNERSFPRFRPIPTQDEIQNIIAMSDPVLRNLWITQTYHDLTLALTDLFGERNVSWPGFATWASKTAGIFIRQEVTSLLIREVMQRAEGALRSLATPQDKRFGAWFSSAGLHTALARSIERILDDVGRHIAEGNFIVFAELAPLYLDLIERFAGRSAFEPAVLAALVGRLRPGPVDAGGQDLLIRAFTHYAHAAFEPDPKARAELIFLANSLVGYHEQTRLQGPIVRALHAPLEEVFFDCLLGLLAVDLPGRADDLLRDSLRASFAPLGRWVARLWRETSTHTLMRLDLPDLSLRVGEDVPALTTTLAFPPELAVLQHPELQPLLAELDRTPDDTRGSAARDWGSLADRMNLIVDVFRSRQQSRVLFDQPFTYLQLEALSEGRLPHGRL